MSAGGLIVGMVLVDLALLFGAWAVLTVAGEFGIHYGTAALIASVAVMPITYLVGPFAVGLLWRDWHAVRRLGASVALGGLGLRLLGVV